MFFFQDNIGVLILMERLSFLKWVFTPVAEHFEPITNALLYAEYKLFHLQFFGYLAVTLILHVLNCILIYLLAKKITRDKFSAFCALSLFAVNLTYTEPLLWNLQGLLLSTFFIYLAFFMWIRFVHAGNLRVFLCSVLLLGISGFCYGLGVGAGAVFGVTTVLYSRKYLRSKQILFPLCYLFIGIGTYLLGPMLISNFSSHVTPRFSGSSKDLLLYSAFVAAGVARGVVGRLFLPGFEPRHFEILPTVLSFIPALLMIFLIVWYIRKKTDKSKKSFRTVIALIPFIIFPYIWAGFVRYHFGLKQALAERYAYPSLFSFSIVLAILFNNLRENKYLRKNIIIIFLSVLLACQSLLFFRNALIFEERPVQTEKYFRMTENILKRNNIILDLPLPSYINQQFTISDLSPVLIGKRKIEFIKPAGNFCSRNFRLSLDDKETLSYYKIQAQDSVVGKVFNGKMLDRCIDGEDSL